VYQEQKTSCEIEDNLKESLVHWQTISNLILKIRHRWIEDPIGAICFRLADELVKRRNYLMLSSANSSMIASLDLTILQFRMNLETYLVYKHRTSLDLELAYQDICDVHRRTLAAFNNSATSSAKIVDDLKLKTLVNTKTIEELKKKVKQLAEQKCECKTCKKTKVKRQKCSKDSSPSATSEHGDD
jgi:hypothetical protein